MFSARTQVAMPTLFLPFGLIDYVRSDPIDLPIGQTVNLGKYSVLPPFTNIYGRKKDFVTEKSKNLQIVYKFRQKHTKKGFVSVCKRFASSLRRRCRSVRTETA